jgi:two-component system, NarL family, sensor histidine kinase UhpB
MRRILKCPISREMVDAYQEGLLAYLARPHEPALRRARELGRNAMACGLSLSEMSVIHHESVRKILLRTLDMEPCKHPGSADSGPRPDSCPSLGSPAAEESTFTMAAASFFAECVSPFEIGHREIRQANTALRYRNRKLEEQVRRSSTLMFDEALQLVAAASLALDKASHAPAPTSGGKLEEIQSLLDRIGHHLAACAADLWPRVLEDLGLEAAIQSISRRFSATAQIDIEVDTSVGPLLPVVSTVLYRAVEESLTNVLRHARATHVRIRLYDEADVVQCSIGDNGIGFDPSEVLSGRADRGSGLFSVRESLKGVGGTLSVNSTPGSGTEIVMTIRQESRIGDEAYIPG